jgi:hypothetical protein
MAMSPTSQKSPEPPAPTPKWYEFDSITPFHDVIALVGFLLLVGGVAVFSVGAALIVAGGGLLALGWLMAKSVS